MLVGKEMRVGVTPSGVVTVLAHQHWFPTGPKVSPVFEIMAAHHSQFKAVMVDL